ncbi:dense-granule antigen DG32 [Toxoplasma gondii GAB2-2007-GAL-DOM2]|uniref:Dense-granule antigen DG32 n=7 Tax=Toxoplasma gondii TaxID=5811 RepID=B9PYT2_TOXGV|nr:dense-granule antigen DG32 [Toxoplasma gondii GT1]ESS30084.1 dense-granule antigen DG32 [Toxoplasma gondii VEG]KFG36242.1 dense-granule antigen DG32 [Toxoplasma gondii p89]KFG41611.1 dense-granule antigen DG32 [Toxoplasma gondii GAB2-2007-GAL-DOM2]KFG47706.1 dense-granule antigen DG32 [Toxoplasma gondii FOU]RQX74888.1 dense-granule antigen DG32 [Toxoplasma gondii CAST]
MKSGSCPFTFSPTLSHPLEIAWRARPLQWPEIERQPEPAAPCGALYPASRVLSFSPTMRAIRSVVGLPVMGAAVFLGLLSGELPNSSVLPVPEVASTPFLLSVAADGDGGKNYAEVAKVEALTNMISTPIELFVKDVWQQLFHKSGKPVWENMLFKFGSMIRHRAAHKATLVIMWELRHFLYGTAKVNPSAWKKLETKFESYLREWWMTVPEDPWAALHAGAWKSLLKLYNEDLEPLLRGSPKLKDLESILFDSKLATIRRWTDEAHIEVMKGRTSNMVPRLEALSAKMAVKQKAMQGKQ